MPDVIEFEEDVVKQRFKDMNGRCECERKVCGHAGRCRRTFTYRDRTTSDDNYGWQANHRRSSGGGGYGNCEILCVPCHKNTASYGVRKT